jgi:hypothetical protein
MQRRQEAVAELEETEIIGVIRYTIGWLLWGLLLLFYALIIRLIKNSPNDFSCFPLRQRFSPFRMLLLRLALVAMVILTQNIWHVL